MSERYWECINLEKIEDLISENVERAFDLEFSERPVGWFKISDTGRLQFIVAGPEKRTEDGFGDIYTKKFDMLDLAEQFATEYERFGPTLDEEKQQIMNVIRLVDEFSEKLKEECQKYLK